MRIKTIIIIVITILLTIVLMQNTGRVNFDFLWATFWMSKLVVLLFVAVISFILGVLVGRPKRVKRLGGDYIEPDLKKDSSNTLSSEDNDYIN
ncbi:LapA family protein [Mucilaginibacter xinganensis]|uniref:Lipopolysaccharide assembly protein A domain-containing protein n=1 Tax=Mucilaginibacter xinganensis TaxID=1234841 RepID=A0A223NV57_9SPHI|nr:LapA family protein [Mucilaginibacter xinganensis]ASU33769.1 hypothetical protein MuYL_1873 [Mucilaginibacter xinganensis]